MPTVTGVAHLSLTVRNLRISETWYRELFGLERVTDDRHPRFDTVVLRDPSSHMVISLRKHHGAGTARFDESRTGLDHVSFGVADRATLEGWEKRLKEFDVEHSPITETPFGAVLVFRDPDHIQLEFTCAKEDAEKGGASDTAAAKETAARDGAATG
ncbi:MAG: VOC family protein [Acidimicrobiales bacterium]